MGNRNRTAGIRAEQKIAQELRDMGFDNVVTTRAESKNLDDMGVDLMQIKCKNPLPCFFQIKKTLNTPNVQELLSRDLDKPLAIIHIKTEKRKSKFFEVGQYVYVNKDFFYKLLQNGLTEFKKDTPSS